MCVTELNMEIQLFSVYYNCKLSHFASDFLCCI